MSTKIIKTKTGGTWNLDIPAKSNLITHITSTGGTTMSTLTILGVSGTHVEFGEDKTDLLVVDQFGTEYEICEDFIWQ